MSSTVVAKRERSEIDVEEENLLRKKQHVEDANEDSDENDKTVSEFTALQTYRKMASEASLNKAQVLRTGDINIALGKLREVNSLFGKVNNKSQNNSIFAHDSMAMLNISELTELSIKQLNFGNLRTSINLNDIILHSKKFMLKEYFKINNINEQRDQSIEDELDENGNDNENEIENNENAKNSIKQQTMKKKYLDQFNEYDRFNQFNWFKMGSLFNKNSKDISVTDHLVGPFSYEKKIRAPTVRRQEDKTKSQVDKADDVTRKDLNSTQDVTTPEQVIKCFKVLFKRNRYKSMSLFKFIINPDSYSKTVENLFYTSFLIKEGKIMLEEDEENGFPTIRVLDDLRTLSPEQQAIEKQRRKDAQQHHIIFQLDMPTWRKLIKKFDIKESYIA